ncbi:MAG: RsmE family RNA methyltransferase [Pseudomonadota bacterium]
MPSFFAPDLNLESSFVYLSPEESQHLSRARRMDVGAEVSLINGAGCRARGVYAGIEGRLAKIERIQGTQHAPSDLQVTIAAAIPKGDRMRTMLDMLAQIGIHSFVPLECDRSNTNSVKGSAASKWQRYLIEACKQSDNPFLPSLQKTMTLKELLTNSEDQALFVAQPTGKRMTAMPGSKRLIGIVGPEGGFSAAEIGLLKGTQVTEIGLGQHILRTETAAILLASKFNV